MAHLNPMFLLNLVAILLLGMGAILSLFPVFMVSPQLQGALWGGLIAWVAAARINGKTSSSTP